MEDPVRAGRMSCDPLTSSAEDMDSLGAALKRVLCWSRTTCTAGILDLHALYYPMALGMEGSGEHMLDVQAPPGTQPQSRGELGPLVHCNWGRHAKMCHPVGDEGICARAGSMLRRGTASTHLVDLSIMVNRYMWLSEEAGRGPTRSTCTWENLRAGVGMAWRGAAAACVPSPAGTAGRPSTWLPCPCQYLSTQNVQSPCVWWHYAGVGHAVNGVGSASGTSGLCKCGGGGYRFVLETIFWGV
jgi:hypothetical protein